MADSAAGTTKATAKKNDDSVYADDPLAGVGTGYETADTAANAVTKPADIDSENMNTPDNPVGYGNEATDSDGKKIYTGLFNFDKAFKTVNAWDPGDDQMANAAQAGMMLDYVQSGMDNLAAKDMAYTNAAIATGQMMDAANLEMRNTAQTMYDQFQYNTRNKGFEFDLQTEFANNQANRDRKTMALAGDIQQNQTLVESEAQLQQMEEAGYQQRETAAIQGYQERETLKEAGTQDILRADAQAKAQAFVTQQQGKEERANIGQQSVADIALTEAQAQNTIDQLKETGVQARKGLQLSLIHI